MKNASASGSSKSQMLPISLPALSSRCFRIPAYCYKYLKARIIDVKTKVATENVPLLILPCF